MPSPKHASSALATLLAALMLAPFAGCVSLSGEHTDIRHLDDVTDVQLANYGAPHPGQTTYHSGSLLVVFTYGAGQPGTGWGNGLRDIANTLRHRYPDAHIITRGCFDHDGIEQTVESHDGPVALIGHSFGGSKSVELAKHLHRSVQYLILLDPVPSGDWALRHAGKYFEIPASVIRSVCFYRPAGLWPISYPINNPASQNDNRLRELEHSEFCHNAEVRDCVLEACAEIQTLK